MSFIEDIKEKAKNNIKTIILPEAEDIRTLKATEQILKEGFEFNEFNIIQKENNINNKNKKKNKKKANPYLILNKNNNDDSVDNPDNKEENINNDIKSGNDADSMTEENFTDEINSKEN